MDQLSSIMTDFPAAIVYFIITLLALTLSLLPMLKTSIRSGINPTRHFLVGLMVLLSLQLIDLALNAIGWIISFDKFRILLILDRTLSMFSLICLLWILLQDGRRHIWTILAGSLGVLTLLISLISILMFIFSSAKSLYFNAWVSGIWYMVGFFLCLAGFIFLLVKSRTQKLIRLITLAIAACGFVAQMFLPGDNFLPGYIRLSQVVFYPILILYFYSSQFVQSSSEYISSTPPNRPSRLDLTPRVASALLENSLQGSSKKLLNSLTHSISLLVMADICAIIQLDRKNSQLHIQNIYDLFLEDYLKDFNLSFSQVPDLSRAFMDQVQITISDTKSRDIQSLLDATGYNQLGDVTLFPLKFNGRDVDTGLLFLTPYTLRQGKPEVMQGLEKISPTILQVLDHARELENRKEASDAQLISLNSVTREKDDLKEQLEHSQSLLTELRNEFAISKTNHQKEIQLWDDQQQQLEKEIKSLKEVTERASTALSDLDALQYQKNDLESRLAASSERIHTLQNALLKAKTMIEETVASQNRDELKDESIYAPQQAHATISSELVGTKSTGNRLIDIMTKNYGLVSEALASKGLNFDINYNNNQELTIAKAEWVSEILQNLLINAITVSPNGQSVVLDFSIEQDKGGVGQLVIQVTDHGGGISSQEQSSFFTMIDRQGQPIPGGIGDASAVRNVIRMLKPMQGKFWIKSGIDKPTTFKLHLPGIANSTGENKG
jgi:signal transduction histidine kinase